MSPYILRSQAILDHLKQVGWLLLMVGLPFSNVIMSVATIWMGAVVLLEKWLHRQEASSPKGWKNWSLPNDHSVILLFLYACSLVGMIYTEDLSHGRWDLRMKLPLLAWPLIIAWIRPSTAQQRQQIWGAFIVALLLAVFYCFGVYFRLFGREWIDVRQTSVFISHIRFGMMMALATAVAWWYGSKKGTLGFVMIAMIAGTFSAYLIAIQSLTGVLLIAVVLMWNAIFHIRQWTSMAGRRFILAMVVLVPLITACYVLREASIYFDEPPVALNNLPSHSVGGEKYAHNQDYPLSIKGEWVYGCIAQSELNRCWKNRSGIDTREIDPNGYPISAMIIRYLSAKHLPKDSVGIQQLSDGDIKNILSGQPYPEYAHQNGLQKRLEAIFFEIANYRAGGDPSGHSITQRWEYWRAAYHIIGEQPWMGVGTGDTKTAFALAYQEMNSSLDLKWRLRAHNQWLTQWLTFGIGGLAIFIVCLLLAWWKGKWRFPLWSSFLLIVFLSFCTEDTLESQAGVTFFSFFYCWIRAKTKAEQT
jgi:hypothetical protein